jgi:hypothetical protein
MRGTNDEQLLARIGDTRDPELRLLRRLIEGRPTRMPGPSSRRTYRSAAMQVRHGHVRDVGGWLEITDEGRAWVWRTCDASARPPESVGAESVYFHRTFRRAA